MSNEDLYTWETEYERSWSGKVKRSNGATKSFFSRTGKRSKRTKKEGCKLAWTKSNTRLKEGGEGCPMCDKPNHSFQLFAAGFSSIKVE